MSSGPQFAKFSAGETASCDVNDFECRQTQSREAQLDLESPIMSVAGAD